MNCHYWHELCEDSPEILSLESKKQHMIWKRMRVNKLQQISFWGKTIPLQFNNYLFTVEKK